LQIRPAVTGVIRPCDSGDPLCRYNCGSAAARFSHGMIASRPRPLARGRKCAIPERPDLSRENPCRDRANVLFLAGPGLCFRRVPEKLDWCYEEKNYEEPRGPLHKRPLIGGASPLRGHAWWCALQFCVVPPRTKRPDKIREAKFEKTPRPLAGQTHGAHWIIKKAQRRWKP
jgi:hypothetical protein